MPLKIVRNDITKMNTEAIVNTANSHAVVGSGCDSAVYKAAGHDELLAYRKEWLTVDSESFPQSFLFLQSVCLLILLTEQQAVQVTCCNERPWRSCRHRLCIQQSDHLL